MTDLTPIKPYLLSYPVVYESVAIREIERIGFDSWFEKQLSTFLDCKATNRKGNRLIQTNFIHYNYEISLIVLLIEKLAENKDYYYDKLLKQHNDNLEFEASNGFEYDVSNISNKKTTKKRTKQTSIDFDKPKRETAAERKLKAHIAKIQSLNIKLKPVKNDNTL